MSFAPDFAQECRWFADLAILVAGFSCEIPDSRGRISSLEYADLNRKLALWYGRVREPPAKSGAKLRSPNLHCQRALNLRREVRSDTSKPDANSHFGARRRCTDWTQNRAFAFAVSAQTGPQKWALKAAPISSLETP